MSKELSIPHQLWELDYCYECNADMKGQKSYWTKFVEISNKVYSVKICDKCSDKDGVRQKQIDMKNYFRNKLIEHGLYNQFYKKYKFDLNQDDYCFNNIKRKDGTENWKKYKIIGFRHNRIDFTEKFLFKKNKNRKFNNRKGGLEDKIVNMLLDDGFIIIENGMCLNDKVPYYLKACSLVMEKIN